ncbi:MAG: hypothetical protein NC203_08005 [Firmicutes bacterium]|nr:hypothetical protein [[Eubacterium] siraeum]MCM1488293.1 hypothetical protein [Bacillota bacterium]
MGLITDIEPLKAMEIYFGGGESGFCEDDFIGSEKDRGLIYPPRLKEFLLRFGKLRVNQNIVTLWLPEHVPIVNVPCGGTERKLYTFGEWNHRGIGIFADECGAKDPPVVFVTVKEKEGKSLLELSPTSLSLNDILKYAFVENLFFRSGGSYYIEPEDVGAAVRMYSAKPQKGEKSFLQLMAADKLPRTCICFDEEEDKFVCIEQDKDYEIIDVFSRFITDEEKEKISDSSQRKEKNS